MDRLYHILDEAQTVVTNCDDYPFQMSMNNMQMNMNVNADYVQPLEATSSSVKPIARRRSSKTGTKKRTWKKPKDKPKRPLSAYNLFFQHERNNILAALPTDDSVLDDGLTEEQRRRKHRKTHGKIGFADLARRIADSWKNIDSSSRAVFEARAGIEKQRYKKELEAWKLTQEGIDATKSSSSKRRSAKSKMAKASKPLMHASPNPEALTSLMMASADMEAQRAQMMQVMSNPLLGQQMPPQQQQQHNTAVPRRNSQIHDQLMAECAQNLMQHGNNNNALPMSGMAQFTSLQQQVAAVDVTPISSMQLKLNSHNHNNNQQQLAVSAVPDETFSKETFFEDATDDDETCSDDYYSCESQSQYDSSDDDMDTRSTDSTLEDDLNDFLCEFDTDDVLFT
mmetsp:Transcript_29979/g.49493  ORF Transcript_29979/g.49493 Transcript_29979/m.49493 type:complete len:396 (+) Transcript_29979:63-1250(+)|eukprot:CAMPEP_0119013658 /NCGR_PEP_ID=MMETSP1176-20130426/8702_1 /TAXON_ID=265551 /ORGANISM="Synedropsis recta cf, Strain CCMP1620" /LENGTH=395 /DNA_ID=CAMNT_0006966763 /DNA_START=53 /DNA_END=1240 /DNA_ORIENTATION=-